jgi:hypothetical protein
MPKPIPAPPTPEKLRVKVQNCTTNPLFNDVREHISEHDANPGEGGKPLGWVIETFGFSDDQLMSDPNRVETACRVFEAIAFAMRLESKRAQLRLDPAFGQVKGWSRAVILADNNIHEDKSYRDSLRKAVEIAEDVIKTSQAEIDALLGVLESLNEWLSGAWGDALRKEHAPLVDELVSFLVKDQRERAVELRVPNRRISLAHKAKDLVWVLYKRPYGLDFFSEEFENDVLKAPFEEAFGARGVKLPGGRPMLASLQAPNRGSTKSTKGGRSAEKRAADRAYTLANKGPGKAGKSKK